MSLFKTKSAFFTAIDNSDLKVLRNYISDNKKWLKASYSGQTPLTYAIRRGQSQALQLLLENGADTSQANNRRETPVTCSLISGSNPCLKMLLDHGASPNDEGPLTQPLSRAAEEGNTEAVQLLIAAGADFKTDGNIIGEAAARGRLETVEALLNAGVSAKTKLPQTGAYLMHYAARSGNVAMIDLVFAHNSDLSVLDDSQNTPLHWAVTWERHILAITRLLELGSPLDIRNRSNKTALEYAQYESNTKAVTLIKSVARKRKTLQKETRKEQEIPSFNNYRNDWDLLDNNTIAHTCVYPAIQRSITEIFNFESRERITLVDNLKTPVASMPVIDAFDTLDNEMLKKVFSIYHDKGGTIPSERSQGVKSIARLQQRN